MKEGKRIGTIEEGENWGTKREGGQGRNMMEERRKDRRTGGRRQGGKERTKEQRSHCHRWLQRATPCWILRPTHTHSLRLLVQAAVLLRLPSMSDLKHTAAGRVAHYLETNMTPVNLLLHPSSGEGRGEFLRTSARLLLLWAKNNERVAPWTQTYTDSVL